MLWEWKIQQHQRCKSVKGKKIIDLRNKSENVLIFQVSSRTDESNLSNRVANRNRTRCNESQIDGDEGMTFVDRTPFRLLINTIPNFCNTHFFVTFAHRHAFVSWRGNTWNFPIKIAYFLRVWSTSFRSNDPFSGSTVVITQLNGRKKTCSLK